MHKGINVNEDIDEEILQKNFYGNVGNMLKNRIEDNQKISDNVLNWPENKYDENNENVIVGDSGSVIERLTKIGKFTYDEENMCVNKVVKTKNNNIYDIDGDFKFKTISSMIIEKNKFMKITDYDTNPKSPEIKKEKKCTF